MSIYGAKTIAYGSYWQEMQKLYGKTLLTYLVPSLHEGIQKLWVLIRVNALLSPSNHKTFVDLTAKIMVACSYSILFPPPIETSNPFVPNVLEVKNYK
jgi:hypothetical protein